MSYEKAHKTDPESIIPEESGGLWFLKEELETDEIGLSVLELEPGVSGKAHDETHTGQEEVYYVVEGTVTVDLDDESVTLEADEALRIETEVERQIHNESDEATKLVLVGAPL
ncbi:cupin domain-containing protein [Halostagnicola sp. A-GB9-2]|uniref:cupin domain-containing protein n=1 Tax=Halostagnicola sp. A-GB9-2 TaxID=3048066 RepID=UPI0024BF51A5|nr:cupin domain-containing protein [Halostagnicola sp. A-GB9-2]MDJ1433029.1 cupin domain-containing protein [Halostagnicola sp. A-GB9-2]